MAGILGVKPVSQGFPGNCQDMCLNRKKVFPLLHYTRKNHELVVAMLIKTGCNNIVLHLLFTNVNNIVQHYIIPNSDRLFGCLWSRDIE
jgi:hypothetical protein